MPLSWNEIKDRALRFSREWADEANEHAEAKSFWDDFFNIFGVSRRRVANFERRVKKLDGRDGYIDLLWKGVLLIEHKSRGKDLTRAHTQARDYFHGLTDAELPRYLLVSDFASFRLYDLEGEEAPAEFPLTDLHKHVRLFGFIAGYQARAFKEQDPVNVQAAERMGRLHDALKAAGFEGHALEVLLVRLLFCLFADDTGIFPRHAFHDLIDQRTSEDGANVGMWLAQLFQTLNRTPDQRQRTLDAQLAELPYVNGKLFEETLPLAAFDAKMRQLLLEASALDWSRISPAIFGSMFQSVMDAKARRNLGAHYTSEKNILKLIGPLFLDELTQELEGIGNHEGKLKSFHVKLANLRFLDPACGAGNFLIIAYRELRLLELEVLRRLFAKQGSVLTRVADHVAVDVDQFYGIEIEEFPAQIAQVALWLMDHQMNLRVAELFGEYFARLPLVKAPTIVHGNALRIDWNEVVPAERLDYILGNPPFGGKHYQSKDQRADQALVTAKIKSGSDLDFVANWFIKAADYTAGSDTSVAFVSTNSITQGEQVALLWGYLLNQAKVTITFAHRTFNWTNDARGKAAVHCVIVGFSRQLPTKYRLFDYDRPAGEPSEIVVRQINPYLIDAPNIVVVKRRRPLMNVPEMRYGNKPTDGGNFILSPGEKAALVAEEPAAERWIRRYVGSADFINGIERWCLWLTGIQPDQLRRMPLVLQRVEAVREFRLASSAAPTRKAADIPTEFFYRSQPDSSYVVVPEVSSERRTYIPMGFLPPDVICSNTNYLVPDANLRKFGVLTSNMHMAWVRTVCGRLKSDLRYSGSIVYNNFPWPEIGDSKHDSAIESAAEAVLHTRGQFPSGTLADLYDPLSMPPVLVSAHRHLDKVVEDAYVAAERNAGRKAPKLTTDAERVAFLFERYQAITSLLPVPKKKKARRRRSA
ncbi:class I SAM-dependent DNA methyltransferase [Luteimonas sp. A277]